MNFKIFTVKHLTFKTCFVYVSEKNAKYYDRGVAIELNNDKSYTYFSAQPLLSLKENEIGINRLQAQALGLKENASVLVNIRYDLPNISKITISAISIEDYEVLEILAENVQSTLLSQLRIVNKNQKFIIWISNSLHLTVNVDEVEPVNLGRLGYLTEVVVAPPKHHDTNETQIENANTKWNLLDSLNMFKKTLPESRSLEDEYKKACSSISYRLHSLTDLSQHVKNLDSQYFNIYVHQSHIPKNIASGDLLTLKIIVPPIINANFLEETGLTVETIVVRLHVFDKLPKELKYFYIPILYVNECIFKHFGIKVGSKAFLHNVVEVIPLVKSIEISTNKTNAKDAISKFKLLVNLKCAKENLLLNSAIPLQHNDFLFSVKFVPSNISFCVLDAHFMRNCKFAVVSTDLTSPKVNNEKNNSYCDSFGNYRHIINSIFNLTTLNASSTFETENYLLVGKSGSGKSKLSKIITEKLSEAPFRIHHETVCCKSIKGKSIDSLSKIFSSKLSTLIYYQPSVLVLDDIHSLCEKVVPGEAPTAESLQFNRVSEMLANLFEENLKSNKICIIATCNSILNLNEYIFASRGLHLFKNIYEINDFTKVALKFLFNETFAVENVDFEHLGQKTEGFVIQDLADFTNKAIFEALKDEKSKVNGDHCEIALKNSTALSLKNVQLHSPGDRDFSDIGGLEEVKKSLVESMLWPLQYQNLFNKAPLRLQSGLLLYGPPGTGKTILAGAAAKHCGLRLISIKGPELLSKYIGASEQAVRDVFDKAQSAKPCILFFDEFDSLAPRRGHDSTGVTDRVVNQLLTQLDGVESLSGVCVLAATSRPDLLDPALLRPGRIDKQILCPLPNLKDRLKILKSLSKKIKFDETVNLETISEMSVGYSGADLQAVLYTAQLGVVEEMGVERLKGGGDDVMQINQNQLEEAVRNTRPSLTREENLKYKAIYSKFQSGFDTVDIRSGLQKATLA
ncbi:hypothetical protein FQR65_LT04557 [Abscondita terminalis]|nr:hypothetical protein FQR65_LT04557 [Abscondita terminalis]